jgi:hypothetical protein
LIISPEVQKRLFASPSQLKNALIGELTSKRDEEPKKHDPLFLPFPSPQPPKNSRIIKKTSIEKIDLELIFCYPEAS